MSNRQLTADIIAKESLAILDNQFGWLDRIHRGYEDEWNSDVNGYKKGDTISIRRPADFTVTTGAVMDVQDAIEGKITLQIATQKHVAFALSSSDLALKIDDLSERILKPAVISLINNIAADVLATGYKGFNNWVGVAGQTIDSFGDYFKAPERLNIMTVPAEDRIGILSPSDHAAMLGSQTGLYMTQPATDAYRKAMLGNIGDTDVYMSQLIPNHTTGVRANGTVASQTNGANQDVTFDTAKDTYTQTLLTNNHPTTYTWVAGDVFTLEGCYMVNARTKANTGVLQQFVVTTAATANATTASNTTLTITPPIIFSGPNQTCTLSVVTSTDDLTMTNLGTASTIYRQNLVFHKNALALAMVPLPMPSGSVGGSRKSNRGLSIRVLPIYDGINDVSKWRMDVLYGTKCIDGRLGVRLSGT